MNKTSKQSVKKETKTKRKAQTTAKRPATDVFSAIEIVSIELIRFDFDRQPEDIRSELENSIFTYNVTCEYNNYEKEKKWLFVAFEFSFSKKKKKETDDLLAISAAYALTAGNVKLRTINDRNNIIEILGRSVAWQEFRNLVKFIVSQTGSAVREIPILPNSVTILEDSYHDD